MVSRKQHLTPHIVVLAVYFSLGLMFITGVLLSLTRTSADFGHLLFTEYAGQGYGYTPYFYDWRTGDRRALPDTPVSSVLDSWAVNDQYVFIKPCYLDDPRACPSTTMSLYLKDAVAAMDTLQSLTIGYFRYSLIWSPDARYVVFGGTPFGGNHDMHIMNADGSGLRDLFPGSGPDGDNFVWSPDGQHIAFTSQTGELEIYDLADYRVHSVVNLNLPVAQLLWSPDGRQFALVVETQTGNTDIEIVDTDGGNLKDIPGVPIPLREYQHHPLVWSPDSTRLTWVADNQIFLMNRDGTGIQTYILSGMHVDDPPVWSSDSQNLAFYSYNFDAYNWLRGIYLCIMDTAGHILPLHRVKPFTESPLPLALFWLN